MVDSGSTDCTQEIAVDLSEITPVILTYNEEANIERSLGMLRWAREVVIVDSFSEDRTLEIAGRFRNVRVVQYRFDSHTAKWNFALRETGIATEWVLALDADYILSDEFLRELQSLVPDEATGGYMARFIYCVHGKPLRASLYPPVTVFYRRERAAYRQDGHTQLVAVDGKVASLETPIRHDDRKPLERWLARQWQDAGYEIEKLVHARLGELSWADRVRRVWGLGPLAVLLYCLIGKRLILDGWSGLYYSVQRALVEAILVLRWIEYRCGMAGRWDAR